MLFQQFREVASALPPHAGLRHEGRFTPYAEAAERAERIAGGLLDRGIAPGDPVALLIPSSPDLFVCAYALFAVGAIAVPLNPAATARELRMAADQCGIRAVISAGNAASERLGGDEPRIFVHELAELVRPPRALPPVAGDAAAVYLFSSGSTGRAKVVPHTHAEMLAEGRAAGGSGVTLTPDDVVLNSLPGHHAFGFMSVHFEAASQGATTVYWSDPQPFMMARSRFLAAVASEGITVLPGVPFVFDALAGLSDAVDLRKLRSAYTGGVSLKRPVYDRFIERFGIRLGQGYGSTEFGQAAFNDGSDPAAWDSVGSVLPGTEIEIVDGEIVVRSPHMTRGYLNADAASDAAFTPRGYLTGDLGRIDENGRLYITGRSKLILEVAGMKVDPVEVEDVFLAHPAIAEAVVVGVPDPRSGEQRLKLVAVLRDDADPDAIIRFGRERLSPYKAPGLIEVRDAIPRSATGKILRGKLMEGS